MSDVFEEVEESLRQDKTTLLWEKYGWILYLVGGLIIAIVAAREFMASQAKQAQVERVEVFEAARTALIDGEYSEAEALFSQIAAGESDLAPLASHYLARTRLEGGGDRNGAAAALALSAAKDDPFAQIAALKGAYLEVDTLSLAELETRLAPLLEATGPVQALALELVAAKAYEEGDYARARKEFAFLQIAPDAPQGVASRAEAALAVIPTAPAEPADPPGGAPSETSPEPDSEEEAGQ